MITARLTFVLLEFGSAQWTLFATPADLAANRDRMQRFVREAKSAAALNHPNIAHIYEIGESNGVNFIAMEFIDGHTFGEVIQSETDLRKLVRYLQHVVEGYKGAEAAAEFQRILNHRGWSVRGVLYALAFRSSPPIIAKRISHFKKPCTLMLLSP